jgi:hypothetical protein
MLRLVHNLDRASRRLGDDSDREGGTADTTRALRTKEDRRWRKVEGDEISE